MRRGSPTLLKTKPPPGGGVRTMSQATNTQTGAPLRSAESVIAFENVRHSFGTSLIVDDVSFSVRRGEFVALVGPSGCGKTTLLNIAAGLESLQRGRVTVDGVPIVPGRLIQERRDNVGYAFARDALLPWRTALGNVALALELEGVGKKEAERRAEEELRRVGLGDNLHAYRAQLSQGMRQRVALARTLVRHPTILLMDEPFAALDAQTRLRLQEELSRLVVDLGASVLFVTHDIGEAVALSDRILLMSTRPGRLHGDVLKVDLPRPRVVTHLMADERYLAMCSQVWRHLEEAVGAGAGSLAGTAER